MSVCSCRSCGLKPRQRAAAQHARPHGRTEAGHGPERTRQRSGAPWGAAARFRSTAECGAQALRAPRPPFVPALFVPRFVPVLAAVLAEAFVPRLLAVLF